MITNTIENQITFVILQILLKGFHKREEGDWTWKGESRRQKIHLLGQLEAQKLFSVKLCGRISAVRNLLVNPEKYVN